MQKIATSVGRSTNQPGRSAKMLPEIFTHSTDTYFLRFRREFITICDEAPDPKCAGAILSLFEYWTCVKLAHKSQAEIANAIAVQGGIEPTQGTSLWIWKSTDEMREETLGLFCDNKLRDNREWLIEKGYLQKRNNPARAWDRTLQYRVNIKVVQDALQSQDCAFDSSDLRDDASDLKNRDLRNEQAIPKTTTKHTSKKTKKNTFVATDESPAFVEDNQSNCSSQDNDEADHRQSSHPDTNFVSSSGGTDLENTLTRMLGNRRLISRQARQILNERMSFQSVSNGGNPDGDEGLPTANEAWDTDPVFRDWILTDVNKLYITEWSKRRHFNSVELARLIRRGYAWFERWADETGKRENSSPGKLKTDSPAPEWLLEEIRAQRNNK